MIEIPTREQKVEGTTVTFNPDPTQKNPDDVKVEFSDELWEKYGTAPKRRKYFAYSFRYRVNFFETKVKHVKLYMHPYGKKILWLRRGLLPRIEPLREKIEYFPIPEPHPEPPRPPRLRPYQRALYDSVLDQWQMCGASTLYAAAGSGKTELAISLSRMLLDEDIVDDIFYLTLNRTLVSQTKDRFKKYGYGDKVGMVMGGYEQYGKPITCATVQTLFRNLYQRDEKRVGETKSGGGKRKGRGFTYTLVEDPGGLAEIYKNTDVVILDEVQHVPASTVKKVVLANKSALRLGMSATPWRWDGETLKIYAYMGEIIEPQVTPSNLIRDGTDLYPKPYLVPPMIFMYRFGTEEYEKTYDIKAMASNLVKMGKSPWHEVLDVVLYNRERIREIGRICNLLDDLGLTPILLMARQIEQGRRMWKHLLKEYKMDSEFLYGEMDRETRRRYIRQARGGKLDALIATPIAHEGLNIPNLRALVLTGGGKSSVQSYQKVGRVLRLGPEEKKFGIVIDISDRAAYLNEQWRVRKGEIPPKKLGSMQARGYEDEEEWSVNTVDSIRGLRESLEPLITL